MRAQVIGNGNLKARIPRSFATVLKALQLHGADAGMVRLLRDEQWRALLPMMDRARLTLPFAQLGLSGLPQWVNERLENNLADTALRWERVKSAYREAAATLDAMGLEYLVVKGFTQAPEFVARPELRRQSDLDLFIPQEQISAAVRALKEIGYDACEPEEVYRNSDHVPTLVRFGTWKWNGDIYDPGIPSSIEVHFCLWNDAVSSIPIPEFKEFWNRRRLRALEGLTYSGLHPVDHAGYFAMHILRCIFSGESAAHHLREMGTFLDGSASDDDFWREWIMMHSPRLRSMQAVVFSLAAAWFSCDVPDAVKAEIDSLPSKTQAWIERCGCSSLEILFRRTRDSRLLQLLLVEAGARKRILWKALTPGQISGPTKLASAGLHPTSPGKPKLIASYLAYPGYLLSRVWMNGSIIVRLIANACLVCIPPIRLRPIWPANARDAEGN